LHYLEYTYVEITVTVTHIKVCIQLFGLCYGVAEKC
jgi:hypothetical protein